MNQQYHYTVPFFLEVYLSPEKYTHLAKDYHPLKNSLSKQARPQLHYFFSNLQSGQFGQLPRRGVMRGPNYEKIILRCVKKSI